VSASLKTKLQGRASRVLRDSAKAAMHRRMPEPRSAKKAAASVADGRRRLAEAAAYAFGAETARQEW
jgi:hypothetical protein